MFDGPFYYMPMPINKDGNGPAEAGDTVSVLHEVWDAHCNTVCLCSSEAVARWCATTLAASSQVDAA